MKIIGITGSFGTGKSFVASIFRSYGAEVLDADSIAHEVIAKGKPAYKKIVGAFSRDILDKNGVIKRPELARIVFADKDKVKRLNRIVHPAVIRSIKEEVSRLAGKKDIIVIDAPLLLEANLRSMVDSLVVVKASKAKQVERCMKKFCISKTAVLDRIDRQMSLKKKIKLADFVIDNSGTRSETKERTKKVWRKIYGNS